MTQAPPATPQSSDGTTSDGSIDRRRFLSYIGYGATALVGSGPLLSVLGCASPQVDRVVHPGQWISADGLPLWTSPGYPVPLPGDAGLSSNDRTRLARHDPRDAFVVPEGFRSDILARWGDQFGPVDQPERQVTFGYNNDFTGLVPIAGSDNEFWLFVNHEYVSPRAWLASEAEDGRAHATLRIRADDAEPSIFKYGILSINGWDGPEGATAPLDGMPDSIRAAVREVSDAALAGQGVSVLRVRRGENGRFEVVAEADDHRRIATQTVQNVALDERGRPDFRFTGPTAPLFDEPPRGTFCNCSGGTTPWGTFLTCEENFQDQCDEEVSPAGTLLPERRPAFGGWAERVNGQIVEEHPAPFGLLGTGHAASTPLDGRHYGWVTEIDPATGALRKHTGLGRFRHENVALRVEAGKRLAAYMGDDRRGGHVWKFVSDAVARDPADPANHALLEQGTLFVARFEDDFTGRWVPLEPDTPLRTPEPEHCATGHVKVPSRNVGGHVGVGDTSRDHPALEVARWQEIVEQYASKAFDDCTLGDLIDPEVDPEHQTGVITMDAFAMANAVGGTPTARPEDLEVHPVDRSVYIAFTDATDSSAGSPDQRIFPDSKRENSRQYGAVYRFVEDGDDPGARTFKWGRFVSSGEVAEQGGGFANADNLVFDPQGNLWMVTDITTTSQNFPVARDSVDGTQPGGKQFPGVFGNNALFMIPTQGPEAGIPRLFAVAPMEAELCGPTFTDDGRSLILSIQHPGENRGVRTAERPSEARRYVIHDRDGNPFEQAREVPVGSNFPSTTLGTAPRPCVVCITRDV